MTYQSLLNVIESISLPEISASDYSDVLEFFNDVESEFDFWYDELRSELGFSTEDEMEIELSKIAELFKYYNSIEESILLLYLLSYIEDALDVFYEAYSYPEDNTIYCTVCGKPMLYWGDDSVMLTDEKWNEVIKFYNLVLYEKEARNRASEWYSMCERRGGLKLEEPRNIHTYICNDCIEKVLGHPIYRDDINSSLFNKSYIKSHFGDNNEITENYFDDVDSSLDIGEYTGSNNKSMLPVCDMPTHKLFFELNSSFYKSDGHEKVYKMIKKIIKKLIYYINSSKNIYSYGNFKFIASSYAATLELLKTLINDNSENSGVYADIFDVCNNKSECRFISFDINATFLKPESASKFILFLKKVGHIDNHILINSTTIFSPNDSKVEFYSRVSTVYNMRRPHIINKRVDNDTLGFIQALCKPNMMTKIALAEQSLYTSKEMFCRIIMQNENIIGNTIEKRTDIDANDYSTIVVWTGFPINPVVMYERNDTLVTYNKKTGLQNDDFNKLVKLSQEFVKDKHSGMTAYIGETEENATKKFFLLDDCFIYKNKVYGVFMMVVPEEYKKEYIVN